MGNDLAPVLHRIFYRDGTTRIVPAGAELNRALARKLPAVFFHEVAQVHRCWHCGKESVWEATWLSVPIYGSRYHALMAAGKLRAGTEVYCGVICWNAATGGFELPVVFDVHAEPRDAEREQALYLARIAEQDRARDQTRAATAHRKVPMPEWKGRGWCRWCALIIIYPNGVKKAGQQDTRRNWHPHCFDEYELHSDLGAQFRFVAERDGRRCAWPDCTEEHDLEVDHRIPLWKVRDLPDHERRWYYGPGNLWLQCDRHHKDKTRAEAAERAAIRAAGKAAQRRQPKLL